MSVPGAEGAHGAVRVERVVTAGTFSLDGGTWEVENNVWVVGDDEECVVIDAAHDAVPILAAVGDRQVVAVLSTHGHDDHIGAVPGVQAHAHATSWLHPDDRMLWDRVHDAAPDEELHDGRSIDVAGITLHVIHTPGHSPGSVCFHAPALEAVFTGDTLFAGGPGATGRSFSDFDTIIASIRDRLLALPPHTVVLTGHGDATSVEAEAPHLDEWVARGH